MKEKKQITIPHILGQFVLEARNCEKPRRRFPNNKEQWSIEIIDGVVVGFDGFSYDENNQENPDDESYLVTIHIDYHDRVSFVVSLEDCLSGKPVVDEQYVESLYESDVANQLKTTSCNREQLEELIGKLFKEMKQ